MKKVYIPSVGMVEATEENRTLFTLFGRENEIENATDNKGTDEQDSNGSERVDEQPKHELHVQVQKRPRKKRTNSNAGEPE